MGKYFGTDGFRGEAGVSLTADHAYSIGRVLGYYYGRRKGARPRAVIGKDTRRSCYMLEYALAAGLAASGADAYMLHVVTTPAVSYVTAAEGFDLGVMISASHNPYTDNGIKVLGARGEKIDDGVIAELEELMNGSDALPHARGSEVGAIVDHYQGRNRYIGYLISLSRHSFRGLRIGVDAANGGAWMIARSVLEALGGELHCIGVEPDGLNINREVGSTDPRALCELVKREGLHIGLAFDGDADRCIAVDERGEVVTGDHLMYLFAVAQRERGELYRNTVVTTVMSNLGLYRALSKEGISYEITTVGDRFIYERMKEGGFTLGGEQSGHIIMSKYATTGDGLLTAIKLLEELVEGHRPLSAMVSPVTMFPQLTLNIPVRDKGVADLPEVKVAVEECGRELGDGGRILLRKSGTEPVIRVMVEAESDEKCREIATRVANTVKMAGGETDG